MEKNLVDLEALSKEIRKLGTSYQIYDNEAHRRGMFGFSNMEIKNRFHDILKKYGISEYEKRPDSDGMSTTTEYIMLRDFLTSCLFEESRLKFNFDMLCFDCDVELDVKEIKQ